MAGAGPAAGELERKAHARVAARFRGAGLRVRHVRFTVPGKGRSRDVVGDYDTPARCLEVVMAHTDSMPGTPGADDNASGVGVLVALAPRLAAIKPRCDVWLVATGSEERLRRGLNTRLRFALSLDEVGSRRSFVLRSRVAAVRPGVEGALLSAARSAKVSVTWRRDEGTGNSDHREFQLAGLPGMKLGVAETPAGTSRATAPAVSTTVRSAGRGRWSSGCSAAAELGQPALEERALHRVLDELRSPLV